MLRRRRNCHIFAYDPKGARGPLAAVIDVITIIIGVAHARLLLTFARGRYLIYDLGKPKIP